MYYVYPRDNYIASAFEFLWLELMCKHLFLQCNTIHYNNIKHNMFIYIILYNYYSFGIKITWKFWSSNALAMNLIRTENFLLDTSIYTISSTLNSLKESNCKNLRYVYCAFIRLSSFRRIACWNNFLSEDSMCELILIVLRCIYM